MYDTLTASGRAIDGSPSSRRHITNHTGWPAVRFEEVALALVGKEFELVAGVEPLRDLAVVVQLARLGAEGAFVGDDLDHAVAPVFPAVRLRHALHHHSNGDRGPRLMFALKSSSKSKSSGTSS